MTDDVFKPGDRVVCVNATLNPRKYSPEAIEEIGKLVKEGETYTIETASDWRKSGNNWSITLVEAPLPDGLMSWDSARFKHEVKA